MNLKYKAKSRFMLTFAAALFVILMTGCGGRETEPIQSAEDITMDSDFTEEAAGGIVLTSEITELDEGLSAVRYDGDYGFDAFLSQGGAASDREVISYLAENLLSGMDLGDMLSGVFGCSTISVQSPESDWLFGRNFDWNACEAMVVESHPEDGYVSLSTVNMDFITQNVGGGAIGMALSLDHVKTIAALYAPLDGMNEAGLAVSVNMIQDASSIDQDTDKPDLTTTTAIRLLLDKAGSVEEALELLTQYDLHGSMGMMIHFAIADASGRSVAVEYINNEMVVTETPVLTNFYLAEGEKQGIGTAQSHERYELLLECLDKTPQMTMQDVRDALNRVSKDNFGEFESTEWSIVMNLTTKEASYYHRENYEQAYTFRLEDGQEES